MKISFRTIIVALVVALIGMIIYMKYNPSDNEKINHATTLVGRSFDEEVKLLSSAISVNPNRVSNVEITWLYTDGFLDTYVDIEKYQVSVTSDPRLELASSLWGLSRHADIVSMRLDWEFDGQKYSAVDRNFDGDWDVIARTSNGDQPLSWICNPYSIPSHKVSVESCECGSVFTTYPDYASVVKTKWTNAPTIEQMAEAFDET